MKYFKKVPWRQSLSGKITQGSIVFIAFLFFITSLFLFFVPPSFHIYLFGLVLLATIFFLFFFTRRLTRPLATLITTTERLAQGDFGKETGVFPTDELGNLGRNLDLLAQRLQRLTREINEEKSQLVAILAGISDTLLAVDRSGRLLFLNRAAEELFGLRSPQVLRRHLLEIIRHHELDQLLAEVLTTGETREKETRLFPGREQIFGVYLSPIFEPEGKINGAVILCRDLTNLKRLEQIRAEFVANVSHELRTPLTSIRGFVETLLNGSLEDARVSRRFLQIIQTEAERLQRLIDELLFLSHLESKKEPPSEKAELKEVLAEVEKVLGPSAAKKGVTLDFFTPEPLPSLKISKDFLEQVCLNLIENGIKYTPAGGKVEVSAERIGERVAVTVADTGIGIPAEGLSRLFERFYRVDKARSREMGGTGLGLTIVKHILELYQGKIMVSSTLGKGSTFTFTLPAETSPKI